MAGMERDLVEQLAWRTAMQTFVGILYAHSCLAADDPGGAVEVYRGQAHRILAATWSKGVDEEDLAAVKGAMERLTDRLFDEIETRVAEGIGRNQLGAALADEARSASL